MTLGYKVMIESNSGKWPSWIHQIWWSHWAPASGPSKMNLVCSGQHVCQISCLFTNLHNTPLKNALGPGLHVEFTLPAHLLCLEAFLNMSGKTYSQ